jgi:hypothetical protein
MGRLFTYRSEIVWGLEVLKELPISAGVQSPAMITGSGGYHGRAEIPEFIFR